MTTPSSAPQPDEDARQVKERQRRLEVLRGIVQAEVTRLHEGELSWGEWLAQAHRHGRYGFANTLLIGAQRPSATDVRSYDEWKEHGRQVVRGETGIRIVSRRGRPRPVFDIAQTSGGGSGRSSAPLAPDAVFEELKRLAADLKLYVDRGQGWTYTGRSERRISIEPELGDLDAVTLLAHQLAHVLQRGERIDAAGAHPLDCNGVRCVRADSVAYLVLAHLGMEVSHLSFPPVRSWAGVDPRANPLVAVRVVGENVLLVASGIRRRLDAMPAAEQPRDESKVVVSGPNDITRDSLLAVHADTHAFYRENLAGSWAAEYLSNRGFAAAVQDRWQLGHAPRGRRVLFDHLRGLGHADDVIAAAGLSKRGRDGEPHDTFRDRVVLPFRDEKGAVVGFIGRRRDGAPGPKYLNSPETAIFHKGERLFGLHECRERFARGARPLVVEGPFDAMAVDLAAPAQYVAVAPCGTNLTAAHLETITRHADLNATGVVLALDGDRAGATATLRAWTTLSQVRGPVEVVSLPDERDPADILHHQGCVSVCEALHSLVPLGDLVVDASIERFGGTLEFAEGRLAAARAAVSLVAQMQASDVARQVVRVASRTGLDVAEVTRILTSTFSPEPADDTSAATEDFPLPPLSGPQEHPRVLESAETTDRPSRLNRGRQL